MGRDAVKVLLIIPVALAAALLWVAWINRPRRPRPDADSMSDHSKRMSALAPETQAHQPTARAAAQSPPPGVAAGGGGRDDLADRRSREWRSVQLMESPNEYVVFFTGLDSTPAFRRVPDLAEAVRVVEYLRNELGVLDATVQQLTPIPLTFRTYYRVELAVNGPVSDEPEATSRDREISVAPEPAYSEAAFSSRPADRAAGSADPGAEKPIVLPTDSRLHDTEPVRLGGAPPGVYAGQTPLTGSMQGGAAAGESSVGQTSHRL